MTTRPAYYLGRRIEVMRPKSHPAIYVYQWVRQELPNDHRWTRLRLVKTDAFWADEYRKRVNLA
jgi:hypothetical protein